MRDYFRQTMTVVVDPSTWIDLASVTAFLACLGLAFIGMGWGP